jgi:two-component system NtrC family sensor kinase
VSEAEAEARVPGSGSTLRWRIVGALLAVSLVPLLVMGGGAWVVLGGMIERRALQLQHMLVLSHARSVEAFVEGQRRLIELLAATSSLGQLVDQGRLERGLAGLNQASGNGFVDLGVISAQGEHLAYAGPFDLAGRSYSDAGWFREVMANGVYVSDVFLGYRQVPHLVIAVRAHDRAGPWILRATISSERFDAIVRSSELGADADAYLVSRDGRYQTTPRVGAVLDTAPLQPVLHRGVREQRMTVDGMRRIVMSTWINGSRWQLVVSASETEVAAPVHRAVAKGLLVAVVSALVVIVTTVGATRHLGRQIDRANAAREQIFQAFLRSAKLASIGELATGLAHEINNPLAIISAESTNIADVLAEAGAGAETGAAAVGPALDELAESNRRIRRQVERCSGITTKMLQFGRQRDSTLDLTDLAPHLGSIVALLERQARLRNVELELDVADRLPRVCVDPVELEQVVVNLVNNSLYALPDGGQVRVRARAEGAEVLLEVEDTGSGMSAEARERAFEPFYTTKPVGHGTGLGLSVCHGIVSGWGGRMTLASQVGRGTTVTLRLPLPTSEEMAGRHA